jgi:hypothetical protein
MHHDSNVLWTVCNDYNDWKSACITIQMCCGMCAMIIMIGWKSEYHDSNVL